MANILVVDDDKDILRLLEFTLKRAGHTVQVANNGEEGLAETQARRPDLVVCDVMMPKITGYEFCKRVRADPNLQHIPIIIFSARFQPVDKRTALDAGATDYLPKSTAPDALVKRITELLPTSEPTTASGLIGLFSLRGGVGVTSLAVNLAIALKLSQNSEVALVDMALQGGHAAVMLGLRPTSNVAKVIAASQDNFTPEKLRSHFIQHNSGVQLLASPPTFLPKIPLTNNNLHHLVTSLTSVFPLVVLDVPHILEKNFTPILQLMDKVILILSTDMPSLQSTAIALQGLTQLGLSGDNIELVVNQVTPHHALPIATIEKALRRRVSATIPFDPEMLKAVNSGKPLLLNAPHSPTTAAIGKLAMSLFT